MVPAAQRLGLLPIRFFEDLFGWLLNLPPFIAACVMLLISPVGVWVLRLFAGRILRFEDEWRSFLADVFFAPAFALSLVLVNGMPLRRLSGTGLVISEIFQVLVLVVCVVGAVLHVRAESQQYTAGEHFSPTALYHNVVLYVLIGFPLTLSGVVGFIFGPWSVVGVLARVGVVICIWIWIRAIKYDGTHKFNRHGESKFWLAHGPSEWWWQGGYKQLPYWLRRFAQPGWWRL